MKTVHEVSSLTGVSIRTLQYYDRIGLLPPAAYSASGYRLYDDASLRRLQEILLLRELEFPLRDIRAMLAQPDFDRERALCQQLTLLRLKKEHIENLIALVEDLQSKGEHTMDFQAFDKSRLAQYAEEAKRTWGGTAAYREYEEKSAGRSDEQQTALGQGLMALFAEFGEMKALSPDAPEVRAQVKKLQSYITGHYYTCTDAILHGLGKLYAAGGEFTANIDAAGGEGTAAFVSRAIEACCAER